MHGTTPDRLSAMTPEPDPSIAQGVLDAAATNGGLPPTGTGASIAHVIGPDDTVYRRGTDGADRASLGLMGTLNEIRGQHIAATGKAHADAGDTAALINNALINHALDHGAVDMASLAESYVETAAGGGTGFQ